MTAPRRRKIDIRESAGTIIVVLALLCAANLTFVLLFVRPLSAKLAVLEADAGSKSQRAAKRRAEVEGLEVYARQLVETRANLVRLRDEVLSTRERKMIETQIEVAGIAQRFGTTFDQMRFENEVLLDEELERFAIVVPLEGGYANLRRFIQAIEGTGRFLVIERVVLGQGGDGGSLLQLNITVATYFIAPKRMGGAVAVAAAERS